MGTDPAEFKDVYLKGVFLWDDPDQVSDPRSLESWCRVDSSVFLMHHDLSDLETLILIRIIPKEKYFCSSVLICDFLFKAVWPWKVKMAFAHFVLSDTL